MKNKLCLLNGLLLTVFFCSNLFAQTDAFESGKSYLSVGYGLELYNASKIYVAEDKENYEYSGIGPITVKFEHGLGDEFGLGVVVGYSQSQVQWTGNNGLEDYTYNFKFQKLTAVARMNWHFFTDEHWDAYGGIGVGYKSSTFSWDTNDTDYDQEEFNGLPAAMSFSMGARYYFNPNIGLFFETGIGHGYMQAGLQAKF